tara:strand:+ start:1212 stop:1394 length:183 start_codon:yes stop_codon:yes gene_type:complete
MALRLRATVAGRGGHTGGVNAAMSVSELRSRRRSSGIVGAAAAALAKPRPEASSRQASTA